MSPKHHLLRLPRIAGLSLLGALLFYHLVTALLTGLADLYAGPAMVYLLDMKNRGLALAAEDWWAVENRLNRALALAPDNPDYLSTLGYLQQLGSRQEQDTFDSVEKAQLESLAYQSYAQAAAQRPTWPYDWGDMALEQYRQGNFSDAPYHRALVNAARFGPWKDDIQLLVAELSLDTWDDLNLAARGALLTTIDRGLRRQPGKMLSIIQAHPAWASVCELGQGGGAALPSLPNLRAECQRR
jgi:hypothetical protein